MPRIVVSGYYGFQNAGDEAILEVITREIPKRLPGAETTAVSPRDKLFLVFRTIRNCELFISGGGGLLQDATGPLSIPYYLGLITLARTLRKKVVVLGQGIGPIKSFWNRFLTGWVLNRVDLITVRDNASKVLLEELGVNRAPIFVFPDLTFLLPEANKERGGEILRAVGVKREEALLWAGISVREPTQKSTAYFKAVAQAADHLIERYRAQIVFVPYHYPVDVETAYQAAALMKNRPIIISRQFSPRELLDILPQFNLFLGMRLHSLIFAALAAVPVVGITYDPKVQEFLKTIDQPAFDPLTQPVDKLISHLDQVLQEGDRIREALRRKVSTLKEESRQHFDLLESILKVPDKVNILGITIDNLTMTETLAKIETFLTDGKPHLVFTPNPEIIMRAQRDEDLKNIINSADLKTADGASLVVCSKLFLGKPLKERITGIDLMQNLVEVAGRKGYRIFFLGGGEKTVQRAADNLRSKYPEIKIVGLHHGYFSEAEDEKIIQAIKAARPDILFVGLGAPRQERWLHKYKDQLNVPVAMVVGGSFDVLAGLKKRAPEWMIKTNTEWIYRLLTEPKRWKRQLALPRFLWALYTRGRKAY